MELSCECEFIALSAQQPIVDFDCGDADLNEFFNIDALKYQEQMLGQTYFFRQKESGKTASGKTVCAFSLAPDGLKTFDLPNSRKKKVRESIPREKAFKSYPAFLIGRLGVAVEFNGQGVGSQLIKHIKYSCFDNYRNFCRFLLVDAYNEPSVLNFYRKNDFIPVFSTEEQERDYYRPDSTDSLRTRYMYFDMIQWKNKIFK